MLNLKPFKKFKKGTVDVLLFLFLNFILQGIESKFSVFRSVPYLSTGFLICVSLLVHVPSFRLLKLFSPPGYFFPLNNFLSILQKLEK